MEENAWWFHRCARRSLRCVQRRIGLHSDKCYFHQADGQIFPERLTPVLLCMRPANVGLSVSRVSRCGADEGEKKAAGSIRTTPHGTASKVSRSSVPIWMQRFTSSRHGRCLMELYSLCAIRFNGGAGFNTLCAATGKFMMEVPAAR